MEMKRIILIVITLLSTICIISCLPRKENKDTDNIGERVVLKTDMGEVTIILYPETPKHSQNFLNLVRSGFYDGISFHRVIANFMIQTGDPSTRGFSHELDSVYTIEPEFDNENFHRFGAVAAAREDDSVNPGKLSSGTLFYIVVGQKFSANELDEITSVRNERKKRELFNMLVMEKANMIIDDGGNPDFGTIQGEIQKIFPAIWDTFPKFSMSEHQKSAYIEYGGAPHLDGDYTVFGEVIEGMDVVVKISEMSTNRFDVPIDDIRIKKAFIE